MHIYTNGRESVQAIRYNGLSDYNGDEVHQAIQDAVGFETEVFTSSPPVFSVPMAGGGMSLYPGQWLVIKHNGSLQVWTNTDFTAFYRIQ